MADQGVNPDQPGRIEVGLSFLSAQDSAAFREMKEAFDQAGKMFEAMRASNFVDQAQKLTELTQKMNTEHERRQQAVARDQEMQQRGGGLRGAIRGAMEGWRAPTTQEASERLTEAHRQQDEAAERAKRTINQQEHERLERLDAMSDEMREAERQRRRSPLRRTDPEAFERIFGSVTDEDQPEGVQRVEPLRGEPTQELRIPRFGELNIQDLLNELRDRQLRQALTTEDPEEAQTRLDRAGQLQDVSDLTGLGYGGLQILRRARQGMARVSNFTAAFETPGAAMGFRRDTNPFSDILGVQTPFSAAGEQGARQIQNTLGLRLRAGINGEQAAAITGATAQAGFSGQQGTDVAYQFMAPMFRQFGVDPENLIPFTGALRTGTTSIQELNRELGNLGEVARTAHTDVNSMAQALAQSGEAAQQAGGYQMSGVRFGREFTQATGLMPQTGNQMLQNPTTQALLAGATGLPTFAQAAAPTGAKVEASQQALRMYYNAYGGALGTRGTQQAVTIHGRQVGTVEGDNPAMAAAAQQFGISADEAERMLNGRDFATRSVNLENVLTMQEQRLNRGDPTRAAVHVSDRRLAQEGLRVRNGRVERQVSSGADGSADWRADQQAANQFNKLAGVRVSGGNDKQMRDQLVAAAHEAGIRGSELGKAVDDEKDPRKRIANVRRLMAERAAEEQAKYEIAFTGPAKKLFKALVKNAGGNAKDWDAPDNVSYGSNQGPTNLNDGTNTGIPPSSFNTGSE